MMFNRFITFSGFIGLQTMDAVKLHIQKVKHEMVFVDGFTVIARVPGGNKMRLQARGLNTLCDWLK